MEQLFDEFMVYLPLTTLWSLLASCAGLVSVGQQAYIGFSAHVAFSLKPLAK